MPSFWQTFRNAKSKDTLTDAAPSEVAADEIVTLLRNGHPDFFEKLIDYTVLLSGSRIRRDDAEEIVRGEIEAFAKTMTSSDRQALGKRRTGIEVSPIEHFVLDISERLVTRSLSTPLFVKAQTLPPQPGIDEGEYLRRSTETIDNRTRQIMLHYRAANPIYYHELEAAVTGNRPLREYLRQKERAPLTREELPTAIAAVIRCFVAEHMEPSNAIDWQQPDIYAIHRQIQDHFIDRHCASIFFTLTREKTPQKGEKHTSPDAVIAFLKDTVESQWPLKGKCYYEILTDQARRYIADNGPARKLPSLEESRVYVDEAVGRHLRACRNVLPELNGDNTGKIYFGIRHELNNLLQERLPLQAPTHAR